MESVRNILVAVVLSLATSACGAPEPVKCEIWTVCLFVDGGSCRTVAPARASLEVELIGYGFYRAYSIDLGSSSSPEPVGRFRAWFGEVPVERVSLVDDSSLGQVLSGSLPGGLGGGVYGVRIVTPAGCRAELADAVRIEE